MAQPAPFKVRVLKDNTNLRARAGLNAEVAGQLSSGDELSVKSMDADWVEVVAPTNVDFWVLGDYLKDGVVVCRQKVNVRAGPGINFSVVGQLQNLDHVETRGSHGEWIKIAPPETCSLWVSRPLVEIAAPQEDPSKVAPAKPSPEPEPAAAQMPAPLAKPVEKNPVRQPAPPAALPEKKDETPEPLKQTVSASAPAVSSAPAAAKSAAVPGTVRTDSPQISGHSTQQTAFVIGRHDDKSFKLPEGLDLLPDVSQGQWKEFEGVLHRKNFIVRTPSDFRLVAENEDGSSRTLCFVLGNRSQLDALLFRKLVVRGRQYWVKRHHYPVVVPEKIILK